MSKGNGVTLLADMITGAAKLAKHIERDKIPTPPKVSIKKTICTTALTPGGFAKVIKAAHCLKADSVQVTWNSTLALRNKSWVRRELGIRSFGGLYNE